MTATLIPGVRTYSLGRDSDGNRKYSVAHLVKTDSKLDGPQVVLNCPGLPLIGSVWNFGNDTDLFAYCTPVAQVTIHQEKEGDPAYFWKVTQEFSSQPLERCQDTQVEDPLLEPDKVSGSFRQRTEEAVTDRFGDPLLSSSYELFRGPLVEIETSSPTVTIEQNVAVLGLSNFSQDVNKVNSNAMWGLPARTVKLSNVSWTRKVYGSCNYYYTRTFEFEIDYETWDRNILDEGTKALNGHWDKITGEWSLDHINGVTPDSSDPTHFIRVKDRNGENIRVILDGAGQPLTDSAAPQYRETQFYNETDFFTYGIPASF